MLNITPNKQLVSVKTTNYFGKIAKPTLALRVEGTEFMIKITKMRVSPENVIDNIGNHLLEVVNFDSLFTIIEVFIQHAASVKIVWQLTIVLLLLDAIDAIYTKVLHLRIGKVMLGFCAVFSTIHIHYTP